MLHPLAAAPPSPSLGEVFFSELLGTAFLILLGCGVVANVVLPKVKGEGSNFDLIAWGWGLGVFVGVFVAFKSGGHINPAVTLGMVANGAKEFAPGVPVGVASFFTYVSAQFVGAIIGGVLTWLAYRNHLDERGEAASKLAVFAAEPEIHNPLWNLVTEVISTFALVFVVLVFGETPSSLGPLAAGLLVVGIGASLGGPTGYAINPARDLGPRIAHAILPIRGKGSSDWGYAWIPFTGPVIGGVLAGLAAALYV